MIFISFACVDNSKAQDIVVVGQILSADDASPLESVHVSFKGSDIGTITNNQGFFMIRSPKPQSKLLVSIVGYNNKTIKLKPARDQMLEIFLDENISNLDDIIVFAGENPAYEILRNVDKNRDLNNPDNFTNIAFNKSSKTSLLLTNIKQKTYQRKMLAQLMKGAISREDSTYLLPILAKNELSENFLRIDGDSTNLINSEQNAVEILSNDHWNAFISAYSPKVNFYKPYISFLDKAILSPIARQGRTFYKYYLVDSVYDGTDKHYIIKFSPKAINLPLFTGQMSIDAETFALSSIDVKLDKSANINFVSDFNISHNYTRFAEENNKRYFNTKSHNVALKMDIIPTKNNQFWGAMLTENTSFLDTKSLGDSVDYLPKAEFISYRDNIQEKNMWEKIDTINQSRIKRFVEWGVDLGINQYIHAWKIDIGPVLNLFRYNKYEGPSPILSLRSGQKFAKYFTFGGYFGYGFGDKNYKYGGEIQWRFGPAKRNYLSVFYDNKVINYGYDEYYIYSENKVEDCTHLFNSVYKLVFNPNVKPYVGLRKQLKLAYMYEKPGFRFMADVFGSRTFSNEYMPFLYNGSILPEYSQMSLRLGFRMSWDERSVDYFFNRFYLSSDKPVWNIIAETGLMEVGEYVRPYFKVTTTLKQKISFVLGSFSYNLEASGIYGKVPYPALIVSHAEGSAYLSANRYSLLNDFEFVSDVMVGARLQYQTPGFIFGYIPGIKKLAIRESFRFNITYGATLQDHASVLQIPSEVQPFGNTPYIECGFGFSNIFRILSIESMWRLTHRDNPNAKLWSINFGLNLDF